MQKEDEKTADRAFQTMLKVVSDNHYTLNQMVDRKAHIMIVVNSIILSMIVGKLLDRDWTAWDTLPAIIMGVLSTLSIMFAIWAIQPDRVHGNYSLKQTEKKRGNLLFFGNFLNLRPEEYEQLMVEDMAKDKEYIYRSQVRDIYHLGEVLHKKRSQLRIALRIFLVGILASFISLLLLTILV